VEGLTLFGFYLSEPGVDRRNQTISGGLSFVLSMFSGLRFDLEYIKALNRETYQGLGKKYKEGVFSISVTYLFVLRERKMLGGGLFAARKEHIVTEPFEIALRYEHFDDDRMSEDLNIWTIRNRYSVGIRYSFINIEETGLNAFIAAELRKTTYRVSEDSNEVYLRLGLDF